MTHARIAARPAIRSTVRRRLAVSSALGVSLVVLAAPAAAQVGSYAGYGDVTGLTVNGGTNPVLTPSSPTPTTTRLDVDLNARGTVIDWNGLNVAANGTLAFNNTISATQPLVAVLNRVSGGATTIAGDVQGNNGVEVWISNPGGIIFNQASGKSINASGFVATTLDVGALDFLNGTGGTSLQVPFLGTSGSITGSAQIVSNNRVLALVAPVIQLSGGSYAAGTGAEATAAFVTASDVTMQNNGSPLALTINAGTAVAGNSQQLAAGTTVSGNKALFVMTAQAFQDTLLGIDANVTVSATSGNGVVILAGSEATPFAAADVTIATGLLTNNTGGGSVSIGGTIDAGASRVVIGADSRPSQLLGGVDTPGTITSTGTGRIVAGELAARADGALSLTGANQVATVSALTSSAAIQLTNTVALTVTGAAPVSGVGVTIANGTAALTVTQAIDAGTGLLSLTGGGIDAAGQLTGQGVTLNAGTGDLSLASAAAVTGGGSYTITAADFLGQALAPSFAGTTGNFSITDTAGGFTAPAGLTAPNNLTIVNQAGTLSAGALRATGGALTLTSAGGIALTGGTLRSAGAQAITGPVTLSGATTLTSDNGGAIAFVGTTSTIDGAQSLTVETAGATTFGGAIGATTALTAIETDAGGTTAIDGGGVAAGTQTYRDEVRLGAATTLAGASLSLPGAATIVGQGNDLTLTLTGAGNTVDGAKLTGVRNLLADGTATLGLTGTISTTGTQGYGAVSLEGATTLVSTGAGAAGDITLGAITGNGQDLTVNTAGTTGFGGASSGIATLETDAAGSTAITASLATTVAQRHLGPVTIGGTAPVTVAGGAGTVTIGGALTVANAAATISGGTVTLEGDASGAGGLTIDAGTGGASLQAVSVAGAKTVTSLGTIGATSFGGAGAVSLTAADGADLIVTGGIGAPGAPVGAVTIDGGLVQLNTGGGAAAIVSSGAVSIGQGRAAGSLAITGSVAATGFVSRSTGDTGVGAITVASTGIDLGAGGDIVASGALTATGGDVQVTATGAATVSANVASAGLYAVSGRTVTLGATGGVAVLQTAIGRTNVVATGGAGAAGALTGRAGLTLVSNSDGAGTEPLTIGGVDTGLVDFTGATLRSGGDGNNGLDGTGDLLVTTVNDPAATLKLGNVVARTLQQQLGNGAVGAIDRTGAVTFDSLTLTGDANTITTTGTLTTGNVTLTRGTGGAVNGKSLVLTGDGVNTGTLAQANGVTGTITINAAGTGAGIAAVAGSALGGPLTINAGTGGAVLGLLGGAGAKTIASTGAIGGAGAGGSGFSIAGAGAVDLGAGAGPITVDAIVDQVASLTINGATAAWIGGPVRVAGATAIGQTTATGAVNFNGALTTGSLASRTAGAASFAAVTAANGAGGSIRVASTGGGDVTFAGAVDGGGTLVTDTAGTTRFGGPVGGTTPFASLSTLGTGLVAIDGGSVRTTGTQSYGGPVTLGAATALVGSGGSFAGGIDGGAAFNDLTLTFSSDSSFGGGFFARIGNLVVDGGGTTTLGGTVATRGSQRWDDALVLDAATVLQSDNAGAITLAGLSGANAVTVNTAGVTTFRAGANGLASITTDAGGSTVLNGTLATGGAQTYGDSVTLGSAVTVTSGLALGDAVTFAGTVDGAQALTVTTAGRTVFGGAVGGTTPLASLIVNGGGITAVNGGVVTTSGAQIYTDRLSLGANTVLTGASGSFAGGVSGNGFGLTLNFVAPIDLSGGFDGVGDLDVAGAASLGGTINTGGSQRYRGAVTLAAATLLQSGGGTGTGAIRFDSTVNGARALTVVTGGTTTFNGLVGNLAPLASLEVSGTGPIAFNAGIPAGGSTVATSGLQRYAGAVTLGADARFATAGGDVRFGGTVDGAHLLSVATGGTGVASFAGRLGGATALTGLAVDAQTATVATTGNRVGTIAATVRGGGLTYDDAAALTVGSVGGLTGISTQGTATLSAGGLLTLTQNVTGAASLTGVGITQNVGTTIDARAGTIALDGNDGAILLGGTLVTTNATAGAVRIVDAASLSLATVSAGAGGVTLGGAGGDAITTTIVQAAGGTIAAATLAGNAGGAVTLANAGNNIGTLGAFAANGFSLREENGLAVTGPVSAGTGDLTLALDAGPLTLGGALTAAGTVTLDNPNGSITQTGGAIVAARLTGRSSGGTTLRSAGNAIGTLAGFTNTGAGGFDLVSTGALAITADVDGGQTLAIAADGIGFAGRTLRAATSVALDGRAGAVAGGSALAGTDLTITGGSIDVGTARAATGALRATATGGLLRIGSGNAGGDTVLRATAGRVEFTELTGAGAKSIAAATSIGGGAIAGAGGVTLVGGPATGSANTIAVAAIGAAAPVASLTVNGGSAVTLGTAGSTINVAGATRIGLAADGAATGALTIEGALATGSFTAVATGAVRTGAISATGATGITAGGDLAVGALSGAGNKTLTAGGAIDGGAIDGGEVRVRGGASTAAANTIRLASVGSNAATALLAINGGSAVMIGGPVRVAGAVTIGQGSAAGDLTGALTIGGGVSAASFASTTTGTTRLAAVDSGGPVTITTTGATGDVAFAALAGTGDKRVVAGRSILGINDDGSGGSIDGGAVSLSAGAAGTIMLDTVGTNAALTALTIDGGTAVTLGRAGTTGGVVRVNGATAIGQTTAPGALTVNGAVATGSLASTTTGATVLNGGMTATGGGISIAAGSVVAQTLVASGAVGVSAGGDATVVGGSSGSDFAVSAGGAARVSGNVAAGGAYRVRGAGVSLGTGATVQGARGLVDIAATGGTLAGSDGLTLASNTDGAGNEYLAIDAAGAIDLGGVALIGGTAANASDVSVVARTAGVPVTLATVTGRQLGSFNAARTAIGTLAAGGPVTVTGLVNVQRGLAIATTGGAITVDEVRVTETGQGIALTTAAPTGGAITARVLIANTAGAITVDARGAASVGTSNGGATSVAGTSARVDTATARGALAMTATAGSVTLGTGEVGGTARLSATGGDVEVTTRLAATGATTIAATGAARLAQMTATAGDLQVTAGTGVGGVGTGRANLAATGGNLRVQAGAAALLGTLQAAGGVAVQAASIDATGAVATGGALSLTAAGGNLTLGSGAAGTSALLDTTGTATLGAVTAAGGSAITIRALDAALGGTLRAGQVAFVNRAPAANAFKLGTGTSAGGFQLSTTEVNLVEAATLTVDGGAGNVEFGALAFGTNAGRTNVDVLATGRIDVLGAVSGAGGGRTVRLGGNATSADAKAAVIQMVTTANAGGRLLFDTANLDLRGARIGVGQAQGFLDPLGFGPGGTAASVAVVGELFVGNANSALYNPTFGGSFYNPAGVTYLSANSLTVRYTDYALFQNTGAAGLNAGVALGSQGSPVSNALVLQGSGVNTANSFALFGTINGIGGTPTAVLGPTVISVNNVALATTRVNGCIVGSGAGCLTAVVSQPVLNVFDASRLDVFRTADDLALPFDPVIGTNNEALFSGITLDDVPVTATECADGADTPQCRQTQGEPK